MSESPKASPSEQTLLDVVNLALKRLGWRAALDSDAASPTYGRFLFVGAPDSGISESFETAAELRAFVNAQLVEHCVHSAISNHVRHSLEKGLSTEQALVDVLRLAETAAKQPAEPDQGALLPGTISYRLPVTLQNTEALSPADASLFRELTETCAEAQWALDIDTSAGTPVFTIREDERIVLESEDLEDVDTFVGMHFELRQAALALRAYMMIQLGEVEATFGEALGGLVDVIQSEVDRAFSAATHADFFGTPERYAFSIVPHRIEKAEGVA